MKVTDFLNVSKRSIWLAILRAESKTYTTLEVRSIDMIPFQTKALQNVTIIQGDSGDQVIGFVAERFPDYGEIPRKEIS